MVVERQLHVVVITDGVEQQSHGAAAEEDTQHDAPAGDAGKQQQYSAQCDGDDARLAGRAGDDADKHVQCRGRGVHPGGQFAHGRGTGNGVATPEVVGNPNLVAAHMCRVCEEEEGACHEGGVEEVHAAATEDLLADDDGKDNGQRQLPQRRGDGHNHRDEQTCGQVAFVHLMVAVLRKSKFDEEAHGIAHHDEGKHAQEAEPPHVEPVPVGAGAHGGLVANVPHAEEQGGHQRNHHHDDGALHVHRVADVRAALGDGFGCEGEGVERLVGTPQPSPFALGLNLLEPIF